MLDVAQVANRLGSSTDHVRRLIHGRSLEAINIGSRLRPRWRIASAWLEDFMKKNSNGARESGLEESTRTPEDGLELERRDL